MTIEEMAIAADMAREVPATGVAGRLPWLASVEGLARFAALVRNQALEEAAAACEGINNAEYDTGWGPSKGDCADAVRALKSS